MIGPNRADSLQYSQEYIFKALPVRIKFANRSEASSSVREKWTLRCSFLGAWSPQGIFLQCLYDVHGMSKRARYGMAR
jgi:hypothetical protein